MNAISGRTSHRDGGRCDLSPRRSPSKGTVTTQEAIDHTADKRNAIASASTVDRVVTSAAVIDRPIVDRSIVNRSRAVAATISGNMTATGVARHEMRA